MDFKMNTVIHKGNDYAKSLCALQNKRIEYLEQEIREFDSETLWLLLRQLCRDGRTLETITGLAV